MPMGRHGRHPRWDAGKARVRSAGRAPEANGLHGWPGDLNGYIVGALSGPTRPRVARLVLFCRMGGLGWLSHRMDASSGTRC